MLIRERSETQIRSVSVQSLFERVGFDADGERTILGRTITFVERAHLSYGEAIVQLLEGYRLADAIRVRNGCASLRDIRALQRLESLKWLCLFNENDFAETAAALKQRSDTLLSVAPGEGWRIGFSPHSSASALVVGR
jgi:hypothetical protein